MSVVAAAAIAVLAPAPGAPALAQKAIGDGSPQSYAGPWDLAFDRANRRCRINLTAEETSGGYAVMMPAGCRRAFPKLVGTVTWSPVNGNEVVLQTDEGGAFMAFMPQGGPSLAATVGEEGDVYTLTPTDPARQAAIAATTPAGGMAGAAPSTPGTPASPPEPAARMRNAAMAMAKPAPAPRATAAEVAGNYAVLRAQRDTGCMITLDDKERGPKGSLRARLAPACADQGIVIFDPAGWELGREGLVLIAKRGHQTELKHQDDGTWANAPTGTGSRVLTLKRL